eukprot:SAG22_NODE_1210_length_5162_cov_5.959905_2_plen_1558_part_00
MLLDATGDGTADDVMVFNYGQQNEVLVFRDCPDGQFSTPGRRFCYPCPAYSIGAGGSYRCRYCPAGTVAPSDRTGVPIRGWRSDQEYACVLCLGGTYRSHTQPNETCSECPTGLYATPGAAECSLCDTGRVTNTNTSRSTSCTACGAGKAPNSDRTACEACTAGRFSSFGVDCQECAPPRVVQGSASQCNACAAGEGPNADHTGCDVCAPGRYSAFGAQCTECGAGAIVQEHLRCTRCDPGRFASVSTLDMCEDCPVGLYQGNTGQSSCLMCHRSGRKYTEIVVVDNGLATGCKTCPAGHEPNMNGTECQVCTGATYSVASDCQPCLPGNTPNSNHTACNPIEIGTDVGDKQIMRDHLRNSKTLAAAHNNSKVSIVPAVKVEGKADASELSDISMRSKLSTTFEQELAAILNTRRDAIRVVSLEPSFSSPSSRRALEGRNPSRSEVAVQFHFQVYHENASALLDSFVAQLEDNTSELWRNNRTVLHKINPKAEPRFLVSCPRGRWLDSGVCSNCAAGKYTAEGAPCERCGDPSMIPNSADDGCTCPRDKYSLRFGTIACFESGFLHDWLDLNDYRDVKLAIDSGLGCAPWPTHLPCVNRTEHGTLVIQAGWGLSSHGQAVYTRLETGATSHISLFRCGRADDGDSLNCVGDAAKPINFSAARSICAEGSGGPLCGVCEREWAGGTNQVCSRCTSAGENHEVGPAKETADMQRLAAILCVVLLVFAQLCWTLREYNKKIAPLLAKLRARTLRMLALQRKLSAIGHQDAGRKQAEPEQMDGQVYFEDSDELGARLKIFVSNFQILSLMPDVLDFPYDVFCPVFARFTKLFEWLSFDIFENLSVDCIVQPNLYQKFAFTQSLPLALIAVVLIAERLKSNTHEQTPIKGGGEQTPIRGEDKETHRKRKVQEQALTRVFLILFLLYPTVSSSVFNMFMRRTLDNGECVHRFDSTIDCNFEGMYMVFVVAASCCMVLYPIGIPLAFGVLLFKNRDLLSRDYSEEIDLRSFKQLAKQLCPDHEFIETELERKFMRLDRDRNKLISAEELSRFSILQVLGNHEPPHVKLDLKATGHEVLTKVQVLRAMRSSCGQRWCARDEVPHAMNSEPPWWRCEEGEGGRAKYHFLTKAFEPRYFWFELIEYARKLLLLGILLFADQGSISQMYLSLAISFTVAIITTRTMPYKNWKTDAYKVAMDINLFFTFSCALMLKLNLAGEWLEDEFFDVCMVLSNALVGAVPALWVVLQSVKSMVNNINSVVDKLTPLRPGQKRTCFDRIKLFLKIVLASKEHVQELCTQLEILLEILDGHEPDDVQHDGDDDDDDNDAAATLALAELRHILEPVLQSVGVSWDAKKQLVHETISDPQELQNAIDNPVAFVESLLDGNGGGHHADVLASTAALAIKMFIAQLRPQIESTLKRYSMKWDDILPALELISTLEQVQAAIDDPEKWLADLASESPPIAIRLGIAKLKPILQPLLAQQSLRWSDALPALELISTLEQVQAAIDDPEKWIAGLELVDTLDEAQALIDNPEAFFADLAPASAGYLPGSVEEMHTAAAMTVEGD